MAKSSMASALKAYWLPLILFASSVFYQLFILPRSYPPSHYDVFEINMQSSIEEAAEACEKLSSKWNAGVEVPPTIDFVKIRYAFELLTNPFWKRDYDLYSIDEHNHIIEKAKAQYAGTSFSEIQLPLLEAASFDPGDAFNIITTGNFFSKFDNAKAFLIQLLCWMGLNTRLVELGEVQVAKYLAEKTFTGQPSFPNGLPSLVAFPPRCNSSTCLLRYEGELSVDAVTDWVATMILGLPRISYYSKDTLLRSVTSMDLGCDPQGYSRAGNETTIWYCVILAGRQSPELHKMRETVRRVQEILSTDGMLHSIDQDQPSAAPAVALKEKRLTFTWLDGEAQQRYCFFIIQTANSYETCGPRRDITDVS